MENDPRIEKLFKLLGITEFKMVERVELSKIDKKASLANQGRLEALDDDRVMLIAEAFAEKEPLSPLYPLVLIQLLRGKFKIADGNHRQAACELLDLAWYPHGAYVITQQLSETQEKELIGLANKGHAMPNTLDELVHHAIWLVESRALTQKEAARHVGVPARKLNTQLAFISAEKRITELVGARTLGRIHKSSSERLASIKSDAVAKAATMLAADTKMSSAAVNEFVKDVNAARSEASAMGVIAATRKRYEDEKAATAGHTVEIAKPFRKLQHIVSRVLGYDVDELRDDVVDPSIKKQTLLRVTEAHKRLTEIIEVLKQ